MCFGEEATTRPQVDVQSRAAPLGLSNVAKRDLEPIDASVVFAHRYGMYLLLATTVVTHL
jgi:hypothetical protein